MYILDLDSVYVEIEAEKCYQQIYDTVQLMNKVQPAGHRSKSN